MTYITENNVALALQPGVVTELLRSISHPAIFASLPEQGTTLSLSLSLSSVSLSLSLLQHLYSLLFSYTSSLIW